MKRYRVITSVVLGFLTPQDQYDVSAPAGSILELEGDHTIWLIDGNGRKESITYAYAIDVWLQSGQIVEVSSGG